MIGLFYVQKVRRYQVAYQNGAKDEERDRLDVTLSFPGLKYSYMNGMEAKMQSILVKLFDEEARKSTLAEGQWIVADVTFDTYASEVSGNDYMNCYMNRYVQFQSASMGV